MSEFISVFITASSRDEADKIARALVEERIAPCANIIPGIQSIYRWQGKLTEAEECAIIVKMAADKFDLLQARVTQLHSYECPCIVASPLQEGAVNYLEWLKNS